MALGLSLVAAAAGCGYPDFVFNGSGGGSGSSGSGAAGGGCQVLHDAADCGPSGRCTIVDTGTGALGCVPLSSSPLPRFQACPSDQSCPAGTWCNLATSVCSPFCTTTSECGAGLCVAAVDANGDPIPDIGVCTAHCDPMTVSPCGSGATCVDSATGDFDCAASSFVSEGSDCEYANDCDPGMVCVGATSTDQKCRYWCEPGGEPSSTCTEGICEGVTDSNGNPITYNGETYGYCP